MSLQKLKWIAIFCFVFAMVVLLEGGFMAKDRLAPYPGKVVGTDGKVLFQKSDILAGQDVYQRYGLMDHGSIWGHGTLRGMDREQLRKRAAALLELFKLYPHRHGSIASYSKGMRQRVLLIAALMHDPEILVFDEPLSGLDITSAMVFRKLVKSLGEQGKIIFYCSHVLEVVEKLCSHVLILRQGELVAHGTVNDIQNMSGLASLEDTFSHLMEDDDAEVTARSIVEIMSA